LSVEDSSVYKNKLHSNESSAIEHGMTTLEEYLEDQNISLSCIPPMKTPTQEAPNSYLYTFYAYTPNTIMNGIIKKNKFVDEVKKHLSNLSKNKTLTSGFKISCFYAGWPSQGLFLDYLAIWVSIFTLGSSGLLFVAGYYAVKVYRERHPPEHSSFCRSSLTRRTSMISEQNSRDSIFNEETPHKTSIKIKVTKAPKEPAKKAAKKSPKKPTKTTEKAKASAKKAMKTSKTTKSPTQISLQPVSVSATTLAAAKKDANEVLLNTPEVLLKKTTGKNGSAVKTAASNGTTVATAAVKVKNIGSKTNGKNFESLEMKENSIKVEQKLPLKKNQESRQTDDNISTTNV